MIVEQAEGKIFEEMDALTADLCGVIGVNEDGPASKMIREKLDEWVKKRVVRFQASVKCDPEEAKKDEHYRDELCGRAMTEMESEVMNATRMETIENDDFYLTMYVVSFNNYF